MRALGIYSNLRDALYGFQDNKLDISTTLNLVSRCDVREINNESVVFHDTLCEFVLRLGGELRQEVLGHHLNKIEYSVEFNAKRGDRWAQIKIWDNIHRETTDKVWVIDFYFHLRGEPHWWAQIRYSVLYGQKTVAADISKMVIGEMADRMRTTKSCLH